MRKKLTAAITAAGSLRAFCRENALDLSAASRAVNYLIPVPPTILTAIGLRRSAQRYEKTSLKGKAK